MVLLDSQPHAHSVAADEAALPSAAEKLQFLVQAATELMASDDLSELLRRVLGLSKQLIAADAYALWSFDPVTKSWDIASAEGLSTAYLERAAVVLAGTEPGMHGTIAAADAFTDPLLQGRRDAYREEGIRSVLIVALTVAGTAHGTLVFYYRQPHESAAEDIAIAESLASLASAAINSFRLREQQRAANAALAAANRRLMLLSDASAILSDRRSLIDDNGDAPERIDDVEADSLERLSQLLMPEVADLCVLDLFERGVHTRRVTVAFSPGTRGDLVDAIRIRRWKTSPGSEETFGDAIANGRSVLVSSIDEEWLAACTPSKKQRDVARRLRMRSLMIAPLRIAGEIIGVFTLASMTRHYSQEDLQLVGGLARRAATAIESQRLLQDTRRVAAELRTANAAKDEFLGLVSHELRTPLTTIRGNADVLSRHRASIEAESVDTALVDIANESVRLQRIVDNLLLLARFEQGKLVDRGPVLVIDVVHEIVVRHRRASGGRRFEVVESGEPRPVAFPEGYLELIVENLLTNAEKYSAPDTPITIEIERENDEVLLKVLDEGIGIADGDIAQVFEAFYRSDRASGHAGGIGIGLTVCRRLVEAVGGEIWARKREGGGSEFGFSLPVGSDQTYSPN